MSLGVTFIPGEKHWSRGLILMVVVLKSNPKRVPPEDLELT